MGRVGARGRDGVGVCAASELSLSGFGRGSQDCRGPESHSWRGRARACRSERRRRRSRLVCAGHGVDGFGTGPRVCADGGPVRDERRAANHGRERRARRISGAREATPHGRSLLQPTFLDGSGARGGGARAVRRRCRCGHSGRGFPPRVRGGAHAPEARARGTEGARPIVAPPRSGDVRSAAAGGGFVAIAHAHRRRSSPPRGV
mmetsp:Transcript_26827/g.88038  ORF Transcript_26827/g.88038 Transcript_26827/m.88038 type:complete len:204 (+) Transcript_26827:784-1395(+)